MLDNEHEILAYAAGKMKKNRIRTIVGDASSSRCRLMTFERGRINFRHKTGGPPRRSAAASAVRLRAVAAEAPGVSPGAPPALASRPSSRRSDRPVGEAPGRIPEHPFKFRGPLIGRVHAREHGRDAPWAARSWWRSPPAPPRGIPPRIGVDPGIIGFRPHRAAENVPADLGIDPEAGQQRRHATG